MNLIYYLNQWGQVQHKSSVRSHSKLHFGRWSCLKCTYELAQIWQFEAANLTAFSRNFFLTHRDSPVRKSLEKYGCMFKVKWNTDHNLKSKTTALTFFLTYSVELWCILCHNHIKKCKKKKFKMWSMTLAKALWAAHRHITLLHYVCPEFEFQLLSQSLPFSLSHFTYCHNSTVHSE